MVEYIGYTGSLLWLVSLTMSNSFKLRIFSLMGASAYTLYGQLLSAYPVSVVNGIIVLLDIYHIYRLKRHDGDLFNILEIPAENSRYLQSFLSQHRDNIKKYFPEFDEVSLANCYAVFTLRNFMPVGVCIYEVKSGIIDIKIDYISLDHRDIKGALSLYMDYRQSLKEKGYRELVIEVEHNKYKEYLSNLGYIEDSPGSNVLRKPLA
ncbi:MAG: hypothetical protein ACLFMM_01545 [Methanohalobium sp.]|uniref:hypothetical protein n=1 Tax=Methanohalobium sp. TaxID=2837493 RepID=UPI00397BB52F